MSNEVPGMGATFVKSALVTSPIKLPSAAMAAVAEIEFSEKMKFGSPTRAYGVQQIFMLRIDTKPGDLQITAKIETEGVRTREAAGE